MSSPGIRPRDKQSAAVSGGAKVSRQKLRVLAEDGARAAPPSVAMPRAKTELTALLAGDKLLCLRRPATTATQQNASARAGVSEVDARSPVESPVTNPGPQSDDLAQVIDAWPGLPCNVRAAILALIRETASPDRS